MVRGKMDTPKPKAVALLWLWALHPGIGGPYTGEMDDEDMDEG